MLVTFSGLSRIPLVQIWKRITITASAATMPYCRKLPCRAVFSHPPGERGGGAGAGALEAVFTVGVVVI
jgi:hypothetical protein